MHMSSNDLSCLKACMGVVLAKDSDGHVIDSSDITIQRVNRETRDSFLHRIPILLSTTHVNDMRQTFGAMALRQLQPDRVPLTPFTRRPLLGLIPPNRIGLQQRLFHPTRRRQDVFFVALPAIKSTLLGITRASLLFLPFVWRYR